jgi:hypothetical protein
VILHIFIVICNLKNSYFSSTYLYRLKMEKEQLTTIKQKLTLIERSEKGESMSKLSEEYGIGVQTV